MRTTEHWYLICYDIRDIKRLQKVHRWLRGCAFALQESVFIYAGTQSQWLKFRRTLQQKIKPSADDVKIYQLPVGFTLEFYGQLPWPEGIYFSGYPATTLLPLPGASEGVE